MQHFIRNILAVSGCFRNGICFLVIDHYLVFRGCTKRASNHWKHDCLFWQEEGCGGDVLPVLIVFVGLPYCIQICTIVFDINLATKPTSRDDGLVDRLAS